MLRVPAARRLQHPTSARVAADRTEEDRGEQAGGRACADRHRPEAQPAGHPRQVCGLSLRASCGLGARIFVLRSRRFSDFSENLLSLSPLSLFDFQRLNPSTHHIGRWLETELTRRLRISPTFATAEYFELVVENSAAVRV